MPDPSTIATVHLPDGRVLDAIIFTELFCDLHNTIPGWGCDGCRNFTKKITSFKPLSGPLVADVNKA